MTAEEPVFDIAHLGHIGLLTPKFEESLSREDVLRAADIFLENGVYIETSPHKDAIQQTFFLYVYEPDGHRIEVANAGARFILAPDWKSIVWSEAERSVPKVRLGATKRLSPSTLMARRRYRELRGS